MFKINPKNLQDTFKTFYITFDLVKNLSYIVYKK